MKKLIKKHVKHMNLGVLKIWQNRIASYISMVNFVMLFYLYIIEAPLGLKWYHWALIIPVLLVILLIVDLKRIMPNALSYSFQKNPRMVGLEKDLKEVKENQKQIMNYLKIKEKK